MKPKHTREEVMKEVREQREDFSNRMNEESKSAEVFDLTTPEGREKFLVAHSYFLLPQELEPVLAKIDKIGDLGTSTWYEVVYHDGTGWCSYDNSTTFNDGERVLSWNYCKNIL